MSMLQKHAHHLKLACQIENFDFLGPLGMIFRKYQILKICYNSD